MATKTLTVDPSLDQLILIMPRSVDLVNNMKILFNFSQIFISWKIKAPINDDYACAMFLGLKADSSKAQMIRAILESLAFRVHQIYTVTKREVEFEMREIKLVPENLPDLRNLSKRTKKIFFFFL